ncbi:hypothetical protein BGW36DRAFT_372401, partial [Talaromyces proteolyticus]
SPPAYTPLQPRPLSPNNIFGSDNNDLLLRSLQTPKRKYTWPSTNHDFTSEDYGVVLHFLAGLIIVCVGAPSFELYKHPLDELPGGGILQYGLAGSIIGFIMAVLSLSMLGLGHPRSKCGFFFRAIQMMLYSLAGALLGYGTYVTRDNEACAAGAAQSECYSIRKTAGWRCGIVIVAMCGVIVLQEVVVRALWAVAVIRAGRIGRQREADLGV